VAASSPSSAPSSDARRILLVAPQPFFRVTGTPINILMMCRALSEAGYVVDLATLPYGEDVELPGLRLFRTWKLPLIRDVKVGFSAAKILFNPLLMMLVGSLLVRRRYDVVHAIEEAAFYAVPLARLFGRRSVTDLDSDLCRQLRDHGSPLARGLASPAGWLRRAVLRQSTCALSVARYMTEIARAESPATPVFEINDVPMAEACRPADPAAMAALRYELGLGQARLVVYTGNLDRRQGVEELIEAMVTVCAQHDDAVLLIVGGTPDRIEALGRYARSLGTSDAVRLVGPRPPAIMPEVMGMAAVLASPRLEPDATPLKVFSYMASGRPIVATDLPTHTEVLDRTSAILVTPTADGLAGGIVTVLDDPEAGASLGDRARALVEEHYTFALFKRRLLTMYDAVLSERTAAVATAHGSQGAWLHG
jgi:glycosyltransferase involved in cell wall biosynthesis